MSTSDALRAGIERIQELERELSGVRAERDEAWGARNENAKLRGQRDAALAANKALMTERTNLIDTKREQLAEANRELSGVRRSYFDERKKVIAMSLELKSAREIIEQVIKDHPGVITEAVLASWVQP